MRRMKAIFAAAVLCAAAMPAASWASSEPEYEKYALESVSSGLSTTQAGAHPDFTTSFLLTVKEGLPYGLTRNVTVTLPPGLVANPQAFPKCTQLEFGTDAFESKCPQDAQVGVTDITVGGKINKTFVDSPVYNMPVLGRDMVARFGFYAAQYPDFINVRLDPETHVVVAAVENSPSAAYLIQAVTTLWGLPADPVHDPERLTPAESVRGESPPGGSRQSTLSGEVPFMTNPTSCASGQTVTFAVKSYQLPDVEPTMIAPFPQITGCGALEFNPTPSVRPTTSQGTSGTGLDYEVGLPTKGLQFDNLSYGSELKRSEVILPEGMTINPSEAVGLGVCSEEDLAHETYDSPPNAGCPETSKIGSVTAGSPVVDRTAEGALYIAKPYENPFHSLVALYLVVKIPDRGVLVKLAGKITLNPLTGQITTVFDGLPQLPIASFHLHFREGARAPLITPFACGTYEAVSKMSPWSEPESTVTKEDAFIVESGPGHTPCPTSSIPPFDPTAVAGMVNNAAGSYSPFTMRITRADGEQEITRFSTVMPKGLTGNLTGIPFCPDAAIEAARHKTGGEETASPSCPAASEIGHSIVGAGVGDVLSETPGKLYLAGPYHGSALSLVSITSATAGPFDLGTVVIRFALRINPTTAQVEVDSTGSDPIPHILDGIVVHVREIRVYVDRHDFMINPTNCEPLAIANTIGGAGGDIASAADDTNSTVTSRFQAAECQSLKFKPSFSASTTGKTSRKNGASLAVKLTYPKAPFGTQANIRSVKVDLPKQLPSRLSTLQKACTDKVFESNPAACPEASRVGEAKAVTPILPVPLTGPAYFVSHGGAKFPELVIVLQGYGVTVDLHGETFISKAGITSSTFRTVPDEPVTSFELTLPQGPFSALAANTNLCQVTKTKIVKKKVTVKRNGQKRRVTRKIRKTLAASLIMPTAFTAQNGAVIHQNTPITVTGCARHKAKKAKARKRGKHHGKPKRK